MSDQEEKTDPGGSTPPLESTLVSEMRTMFASLLASELGGLRSEIVDATATAAQVAEQLSRFNHNYELVQKQVESALKRLTLAEERIDDLEVRMHRLETPNGAEGSM